MGVDPFRIAFPGEEDAADVGVLYLDQGDRPVVVIDKGLLERLEYTLANLPKRTTGLVIASAGPRSFVAGADLKAIRDLDDGALAEYLSYAAGVFAKLANLSVPTAAAIGGAALGGGLELAMHCDVLVGGPRDGGRGYPIGLPEAGLAICPGWGGTNLLPARLEPREGIRRTVTGEAMEFGDAARLGMFDKTVDEPGELIPAALKLVARAAKKNTPGRDGAPKRWIGRAECAASVREALDRVSTGMPDTPVARAIAECVRIGLDEGWEAACATERKRLVELRHTPEAVERIKAFFERPKK